MERFKIRIGLDVAHVVKTQIHRTLEPIERRRDVSRSRQDAGQVLPGHRVITEAPHRLLYRLLGLDEFPVIETDDREIDQSFAYPRMIRWEGSSVNL